MLFVVLILTKRQNTLQPILKPVHEEKEEREGKDKTLQLLSLSRAAFRILSKVKLGNDMSELR
jgi:hypothetical protein